MEEGETKPSSAVETLRSPLMRKMSRSDSMTKEEKINTEFGSMVVAVQGDRSKSAFFTYHDLGLNYVTNFQAFFSLADVKFLMEGFCIYHLNAPGQEEEAATFPNGYSYPNMDKLSEMILSVCEHFHIKHFIGFGVGAGANILARFALHHPDFVDGLFLINASCTAASWSEWGHQKLNVLSLRSSGMTSSILDFLMWHHFGKGTGGDEKAKDLHHTYRQHFSKYVNAYNLSLFIDAYIKRSDLQLSRDSDKKEKNFKCHVLVMAGANSPHLEETLTMNSRLMPAKATWMKLSDCALPLDEQPIKVCEALHLFLQGIGYAANLSRRRSSVVTPSVNEIGSGMFRRKSSAAGPIDAASLASLRNATKKQMNITENPIAHAES